MTLLTDPIVNPHNAVSFEGSGCAVAPLDSQIYRENVFCFACERMQEFRIMYEFCCGRIGVCLGCGHERVVPFSRATEAQQ